jgi:hypothetical protein
VMAAAAVLDGAVLMESTVQFPSDAQAALCIRAGNLALRHIADFFSFPYDPDPQRGDPISISRSDYDRVVAELENAGIPIKLDRETAWMDFAGWWVNYDKVLLALAELTMAPPAPWTGKRSEKYQVPVVMGQPKG